MVFQSYVYKVFKTMSSNWSSNFKPTLVYYTEQTIQQNYEEFPTYSDTVFVPNIYYGSTHLCTNLFTQQRRRPNVAQSIGTVIPK